MTTIIFKVSNFIPFDFAFNEIKKSLETILTNKGSEVIEKNLTAIDESLENLNKVKINTDLDKEELKISNNIFDIIDKRHRHIRRVPVGASEMDGDIGGDDRDSSHSTASFPNS